MEKNIACGIDYSMNGPSMCIGDGDFEDCKFFVLGPKSKDLTYLGSKFPNITVKELTQDYINFSDRYERIAVFFIDHILKNNIKKVRIEGYSYGSKGNVFNIAEHTGLLKYLLWKYEIDVEIIEPTKVKKFATSKGNANKQLMNEAFEKWTGVKLAINEKKIGASPYSDVIDSWFLARYKMVL